jgi:hypothetical protein
MQPLKEMGVQMKIRLPLKASILHACFIIGLPLILTACGGGKSEPQAQPKIITPAQTASENASKLCAFSNDDEAKKCVAGQIALFVPQSWGNEQFPIIYAAKYCDFNFPVVHTNGAVSCVFYKGRTVVPSEEKKPSPPPPAADK